MFLVAVAHFRIYRDRPGSSWLMQPRNRVQLGGTCTLCKTKCTHSLPVPARILEMTDCVSKGLNVSDKIKDPSRGGGTRRLI
jgi:hypothetical protein